MEPGFIRHAIGRFFLLILIAIVATVGSYFLFPGWWREQFSAWLLDKPLGRPQTSREAAATGHKIIHQIKDPDFRPTSGKLELEEIQINSVIEEEMDKTHPGGGNGKTDPNNVTAILAEGLSNLQVTIDENSVTIAANVDLKVFAPYIKEHSGHELPPEFQKVTPLRAVTTVSIENRVLKVNFKSFTLGNVPLKNSILSGMISDLTEKLETYLRQTVKSQIPGEFKEISPEEMTYRLPDNVENVEVQKEKITITYKGEAKESGTPP
jgi:hypothetical protein